MATSDKPEVAAGTGKVKARPFWMTLIVSLGLAIVAMLLFRRLGEPVSSPEISDRTRPGTPRHDSRLAVAQSKDRPDDSLEPQNHLRTKALPASLFLRGLAASLESLQTEPDADNQEEKLESLANGIPASDLPEALAFLVGQGASELNQSLSLRLIRRWTEESPRAAADWVLGAVPEPMRAEAITHVTIVWANQNLADATEWARQLTDDQERHSGLISIAYEARRTDPLAALRLAVELPATDARDELIRHSASEWAAKDPGSAAEWANQIADPALRERVAARVATEWGDSDPAAAATFAAESIGSGRNQDDAVVGIVQRWVQKRPDEAAAWVAEFPEGTLRATAMQELVKLWADQDLEHAGNWLAGLVEGSSRDRAVRAYVGKMTPLSPELAAQWAADIGDDALRLRELETVGEAWMGSDADAARSWIAESPLTETAKERLLALKPE